MASDAHSELRRLIDLVSDLADDVGVAEVKAFLESFLDRAGVDPEPLSAEEAVEADRAWAEHVTGRDPGISLDELRRILVVQRRG